MLAGASRDLRTCRELHKSRLDVNGLGLDSLGSANKLVDGVGEIRNALGSILLVGVESFFEPFLRILQGDNGGGGFLGLGTGRVRRDAIRVDVGLEGLDGFVTVLDVCGSFRKHAGALLRGGTVLDLVRNVLNFD